MTPWDLTTATQLELRTAGAATLLARLVEHFNVLTPLAPLGSPSSWTHPGVDGLPGMSSLDGRSVAAALHSGAVTFGGESRLVPIGLGPPSDRRVDNAFVVWVPNTQLALSGGYAWMRRASDMGRRRGTAFSLQVTY